MTTACRVIRPGRHGCRGIRDAGTFVGGLTRGNAVPLERGPGRGGWRNGGRGRVRGAAAGAEGTVRTQLRGAREAAAREYVHAASVRQRGRRTDGLRTRGAARACVRGDPRGTGGTASAVGAGGCTAGTEGGARDACDGYGVRDECGGCDGCGVRDAGGGGGFLGGAGCGIGGGRRALG